MNTIPISQLTWESNERRGGGGGGREFGGGCVVWSVRNQRSVGFLVPVSHAEVGFERALKRAERNAIAGRQVQEERAARQRRKETLEGASWAT